MLQKIVLAAFLAILPLSSTLACQCAPFTDVQRVNVPAAIIPEARVVKIQRGKFPGWPIVTLKVLISGKGAKEGETIKATFTNDNSCSRHIPKIGQKMEKLVLTGQGDIPHAEDGCIGYPSNDSGLGVLAGYRRDWLALDAKARSAPRDAGAQLELGEFFAKWDDNRNARTAFMRAEKLAPKYDKIKLKVAAMEIRLQHLDNAQRILDRVRFPELDGFTQLLQFQLTAQKNRQKEVNVGEVTGRKSYYVSAAAPALTGLDMSGIDLTGVKLTGAFSAVEVIGIEAAQSNWTRARISGSAMPQANLTEANLSSASFKNTDLTGSILTRTDATGTKFVDTTLQNIKARGLKAPNADFSGATLSGSDFTEATLSGANFYTADLSGVDFRGADLRGADFRLAKVDCATQFPDGFIVSGRELLPTETCNGRYALNFDGFNFHAPSRYGRAIYDGWRKVSFEGRDLRGASFRKAELRYKLSFKNANLTGVDFSDADINGADFTDSVAQNARFINAKNQAVFSGTDLTGAILSGDGTVNEYGYRSFKLAIDDSPPKLTGATIRSADIHLRHWEKISPDNPNLTSILDATIEDSTIDCVVLPPHGVSAHKYVAARHKEWANYIILIDIARRVSQSGKANVLSDRCAQAVETYLAGDCRAGQAKTGFAYSCPPAP